MVLNEDIGAGDGGKLRLETDIGACKPWLDAGVVLWDTEVFQLARQEWNLPRPSSKPLATA
jgi:hypothetical protein